MTGQEIRFQLDVLDRDGYHKAKTVIARLLEMDDRDRFLLRIRAQAATGADPAKLRGLWTAWCLTAGAVPGTPEYEKALQGIREDAVPPGLDYDYMSAYVNEAYGLKA